MKNFLKTIDSNRRLAAGMLLAEFKPPWNFLAETTAEARSAEATSLRNQIWWSIFKIVRTHFAACGGEELAKNSACPSEVANEGGNRNPELKNCQRTWAN